MQSAEPCGLVALRFGAEILVLVLVFSEALRSSVRIDVIARRRTTASVSPTPRCRRSRRRGRGPRCRQPAGARPAGHTADRLAQPLHPGQQAHARLAGGGRCSLPARLGLRRPARLVRHEARCAALRSLFAGDQRHPCDQRPRRQGRDSRGNDRRRGRATAVGVRLPAHRAGHRAAPLNHGSAAPRHPPHPAPRCGRSAHLVDHRRCHRRPCPTKM